jgi:hypothetical protein
MMTDGNAKGPLGRMLVYFAVASFIAAVVLIAASALSSSAVPTVGFAVTVKVAEGQVSAAGKAYLTDNRIKFDGDRLAFAGTIEGDKVRIDGKVVSADQATTRDFRASGRIVAGRSNLPLNDTGGRRIGSLRLELPSD